MVYSVAYSPDSRFIATGFEGSFCLWDAESGQLFRSFPAAHDGLVTALAWHPDSSRLASVGHDRLVKLWDAITGRPDQDARRAYRSSSGSGVQR